MKKELFVDTAVAVGEDIYFTAINEWCLYKYSIETCEISLEKEMPIVDMNVKKFISMVNYGDKIWMIPLNEKYFWVYDMAQKKFQYFDIPQECILNNGCSVFRRVVKHMQYMWIIPNYSDCILQINMEKEEYEILNQWPDGVKVRKDKPNFYSASYDNGKLYLFRANCNEHIIINVSDGTMQIWDLPIEGEFGLVKNNRVIISPIKKENKIRIFSCNENLALFDREIALPKNVWINEEIYAFWYIDALSNSIFILPHEANALLVLNMDTYDVEYIKLENNEYKTLRENGLFAVTEVFEVKDKKIIVPYVGNQFIILDKENKIERIVPIYIYSDSQRDMLECFINELVLNDKTLWKNELNLFYTRENKKIGVGKVIYSELRKRR